jgi:hypothetical protein
MICQKQINLNTTVGNPILGHKTVIFDDPAVSNGLTLKNSQKATFLVVKAHQKGGEGRR